MDCWLNRFATSPCEFFPRSGPDPAHLIPQQRLRAAGLGHLSDDPRSWVPACRRHHHAFDQKIIRLDRDDYPATFLDFAQENGLFFDGPDGGWKVAHASPA